jgi:hypothetical protein
MAVFVSPDGSDAAVGSIDAPLKTITKAVAATRKLAATKTIFLRAGTYFVEGTITLTAQDSGLSIEAYNDEPAILSGGVQLSDLQWAQVGEKHVAQLTPAQRARLPAGIPALRINGKRATRARFPNADPERDMFPVGYINATTQWRPLSSLQHTRIEDVHIEQTVWCIRKPYRGWCK